MKKQQHGKQSTFIFTIAFISLFIFLLTYHVNAETQRLAGQNRYETAVEISKKGWQNGTSTIVLARGDDFADALAGAPLAYLYGGPVLLNPTGYLDSTIKAEITRLHAKKIIILGGNGAISTNVEKELRSMKIVVERISGKDRFITANEIAKKLPNKETAILAYGLNFPDALAIAPYAAQKGIPILLTETNKMPSSTNEILKGYGRTIVVGGEGVVSNRVYSQLSNPIRIAGKDRFETASEVVRKLSPAAATLYLALGMDFADALTGSTLAAKEKSVILLSEQNYLPESIQTIIQEKNMKQYTILGGTGVVNNEVEKILQVLKNKPISTSNEKWPILKIKREYSQLVKVSRQGYLKNKNNIEFEPYTLFLQNYTPYNDYLNYSRTGEGIYSNKNLYQFDQEGVPKSNYNGTFYYNPVTISQFALYQYGKYLNGGPIALDSFLSSTNRLLLLQDEQGAFRYPIKWQYYLNSQPYREGWVSGMAQGQALSVLSRAYHVTGDVKYLEAGNKALQFMITPVDKGGTKSTLKDLDPSLDNYVIFEEYLAKPNSFTLNGFMFSLLGLYDWWQIESNATSGTHVIAKDNFQMGVQTLEKILPYYDLGGFTAYDLSHITHDRSPRIGVKYHNVHIYLLNALHSITNEETLKYFGDLWSIYVN